MPRRKQRDSAPVPVMKSYGTQSSAASGTHEGAGVAGIVAIVGMSVILVGRLDVGWVFLVLALVGGGIFALGLYWLRQRRNAKRFTSLASASGGFVGAITLLGVAVVLMACRYYWMRLFLGIAIIAGAVIAVLLRWLQRRNSHISIA